MSDTPRTIQDAFDTFADAVRRLNDLCHDPQPGIYTWVSAVNAVYRQACEAADVLGIPAPDDPRIEPLRVIGQDALDRLKSALAFESEIAALLGLHPTKATRNDIRRALASANRAGVTNVSARALDTFVRFDEDGRMEFLKPDPPSDV